MNPAVRKLFTLTALATVLSCTDVAVAIEAPADAGVDWRGPDGSTALQWAVYEGDVVKARQLIKDGVDIKAANNYGSNAMQLAAEVANVDMLKLLLEAGADADSPNPEGQTALMLVARTGNVDAAKLLIAKKAKVNAREQWSEQTALMWATARRQPAMVEFLASQGADVNAQSKARDYKRHLTKEGRAKSMDAGGLTPVLYAIRENCGECLNILIKRGADLNLPDPEGVSPLLYALINNGWDSAKKLIEAGADVQQWDVYGQAPLAAAVSRRTTTPQHSLDGLNTTDGLTVVRMLLDKGANPNMQAFLRPAKVRGAILRGTTPLILAAGNGDLDVIQLLLQHGADAKLLQADRHSPVAALAGARGNPDQLTQALDLLVAAGAEVNIVSVHHHLQRNRGSSAMHNAAKNNNIKMLEALMAKGGDINIKDFDGLTALDYTMGRGAVGFLGSRQEPNTKLADQLRAMGANVELAAMPFWPNVGPPFYYPWSIFPLDPDAEAAALVPGSFDHQ
jgi:uncharacterized protein